ncbi:MAG: energy transducer TonB [Gammaproteobacteria bacterium]|nr:energy transducer TonB [Gammaproteobacteria bacterium]
MPRRALMLREGNAPVRDRLITMLFLAAMLHGLLILGVTFGAGAVNRGGASGLEVLLVSDELPESDRNPSATYLAQRTQTGSGNTRSSVAPHNRASATPAGKSAGSADGEAPASEDAAGANEAEPVLTSSGWSTQVRYLPDAGTTGAAQARPLIIDQPPVDSPGPQQDADPVTLKGPQRDELWVSPDTRASVLAPYLDAWRHKVERIGTLNYPSAARAQGAPASPVVEVSIDASGNLSDAHIQRSSGNPALDHAALAILKLASPFDPFPPELAAARPLLHFAYEWQFSGGRVGSGTVSPVP